MTSIGNISNSSSLSHPWGGPEKVWSVGRYIKKRLVITWSRHIEIARVIWTGKKNVFLEISLERSLTLKGKKNLCPAE